LLQDPEYEEPPPTGHYHIRVLIPCYKEPEEIVRQTVTAIRTAVLPPGEHCRLKATELHARGDSRLQYYLAGGNDLA